MISRDAIQADNISRNSRGTRKKVCQPVYRAESMSYRSGAEHYIQGDASYSTYKYKYKV